jgi:hypothetical protein
MLAKPLPQQLKAPIDLGSPDQWVGKKLAEVTVVTTNGAQKYHDTAQVQGSAISFDWLLVKPGSEVPLRWTDAEARNPNNIFTLVEGGFGAAVRAANAQSQKVISRDGLPIDAAMGVLQSSDGAHYVTALSTSHLDQQFVAVAMNGYNRGPGMVSKLEGVKPLHPALKAIVDRDEWVDLRQKS